MDFAKALKMCLHLRAHRGMLRRGLYVAGAAVCGFTAVRLRDKYSQKYLSNDTSSAVGVTDAVMLAMRRVVHAQSESSMLLLLDEVLGDRN